MEVGTYPVVVVACTFQAVVEAYTCRVVAEEAYTYLAEAAVACTYPGVGVVDILLGMLEQAVIHPLAMGTD